MNPMHFLIFGAGAIGTYIGGSLALSGQPVTFLELPEVAEGLRARGLRLRLEGAEHALPQPQIAASLPEALASGPFDAAVFALKSNDTRSALESLAPFAGKDLPPILCLQNGVENEPALAAVLGSENVIAGTVTSAIGRNGPGDITLERKRGVGVALGHPLSPRLAEALSAASLNARLFPRPAEMKWSKLLTNLLANASSAILDLTPGDIFAHPGLCRLEVAQLREALRVMSAQGLRPVDLPGTPVRLLALGVRLPPALSRPLLARAVGGGRGGKMPSLHIDLHTGRRLSEVDYLNGAVVRFGSRLGIPTPVNRFLNETLLSLAAGQLPLDTYTRRPEKLLHSCRFLPPVFHV
jgi:2-dehydropantoate 2-reductase